ncbi:tRNA preQ1(34) S-adenosylmethionine ribosyltransferase-isomerase QueA [Candidatus Uhrbacteria bacterium]|nr:tRNA preQ1(34) S-adenosylmethionine ribosyltransferase-isomerase QueA [Candidatus Uhrbacteria bacterium]
METSLFDYTLPEEQIAQRSVEPRDQSRLMVLDRRTGAWHHQRFFQIVDELKKGDVLVFNDTKVFRARLKGTIMENGKALEIFLLRAREGTDWEVLLRPGRTASRGMRIEVAPDLCGKIREKVDDGTVIITFDRSPQEVVAFANAHGDIPTPPYVKEQPASLENYQTIYARETGSVAAPTVGFHFTSELMEKLKHRGVQMEFVTLHVGMGTFRPMKTETLEAHEMHSEFVSIDVATCSRILQAKKEKRRVIAVGTTTARTLEGVSPLKPFVGEVNLFITPGFDFQVIDGLITNFHLPKSTLLVLVSAFAGREHVLAAYQEAIRQSYRFFSFGDAMFIR